jgi:hypothetical protein
MAGAVESLVDPTKRRKNVASRKLQKLDQNNFIVRQDNENGEFVLWKIEMLPNLVRQSEMYVEKDRIRVMEFFYDIENSMLFLISPIG